MLSINKITGNHINSKKCDPDYWVGCSPDVGSSECNPETNMCAPDYGDDGCLPDCEPNFDE